MALNYPGEFEVRVNYEVTLGGTLRRHQHRMSFDANTVGDVGEDFDQWFPILRNGSEAAALDTLFNTYVLALQDIWGGTCDLTTAELWKYAPLSFDAAWQAEEDISLTGTHVGTNNQDGEVIMTFRTGEGGTARAHFLETPELQGIKQARPLSDTDLDDVAGAWISSATWFKGRDGGYPVAFLGMFPGENESMFKDTFR